MSAIATLVDDFTSNDLSTLWSNTYGGTSWASGQVQIPTTTSYPGLASSNTYTFAGSSLSAKVTPATPTTGAEQFFMSVQDTNTGGQNQFQAHTSGSSTIYVRLFQGGSQVFDVDSGVMPANAPYWRLREASGVLYFDTSTDGVSWTNQVSQSYTGTLPAMYAYFVSGNYQSDTPSNLSYVDNVNTSGSAPVTVTVSGTGAGAATSSQTRTTSQTVAGAGSGAASATLTHSTAVAAAGTGSGSGSVSTSTSMSAAVSGSGSGSGTSNGANTFTVAVSGTGSGTATLTQSDGDTVTVSGAAAASGTATVRPGQSINVAGFGSTVGVLIAAPSMRSIAAGSAVGVGAIVNGSPQVTATAVGAALLVRDVDAAVKTRAWRGSLQ